MFKHRIGGSVNLEVEILKRSNSSESNYELRKWITCIAPLVKFHLDLNGKNLSTNLLFKILLILTGLTYELFCNCAKSNVFDLSHSKLKELKTHYLEITETLRLEQTQGIMNFDFFYRP